MVQLDLQGRTKVETAIARIREFEPPEGYYLAFSGGKDSTVLYDLAVRSDVAFDAHYQVTGIDPPELVQHIKRHYPDVRFEMPPESIFAKVAKKGLPRRQGRWCCEFLKERGGAGRRVLLGIRWAESTRRKISRRMVETCFRDDTKTYVNPIIDWNDAEVWAYIKARGLPMCSLYDEGFTRLGCILCPMAGRQRRLLDAARWPKIAQAWYRAAERYWNKGTAGRNAFASPQAFWDWWLSDRAKPDESQLGMFEN